MLPLRNIYRKRYHPLCHITDEVSVIYWWITSDTQDTPVNMYQKKCWVFAHLLLIPIWNLPNKVSVGIWNGRDHSDHRPGRQFCHFPKNTSTMNNQHHLHYHQQQRQYRYNGQQQSNRQFGGGGNSGSGGSAPFNPYESAQKQRRLFPEPMVSLLQ